ncbi:MULTISPECIES: Hsp70 family protein [unclassified Amycolatopsis]|uniref:Hsp70 family protein n=1 Tax=unclassified Amycolatopsis TaxID=2618356 RepID=UPI002876AB67|nr:MULTISPECIES: Hsp70 family protein [unclassified Amycolatopsis]MDS0133218.1 Hsp70 family protein [Amycolatopsis sp. 505]MDS0146448.1 Hsp70 family protein [Amycolatopsis sp. CM201R]
MNPYGIDFGTTNSVLAQWNGREVEVLSIDSPPGEWEQLGFDKVMPSVVGVSPDGHRTTFGWAAKRQQEGKLETVKRLFATEEFVDIGGSRVSVEEAAALLFAHLRNASAGVEVDRAVVTIPANSRGLARYRTKLCAGLAGIDVQALVNEPTAAAMAYAVDARRDQNILVFDWGGGTLDVTVLETIEGVFIERASKGIPRSGGVDLDEAFGLAIRGLLPRPPSWSPAQEAQFRLEVERAKILLSAQEETNLRLPDGGYVQVDRLLFENAIRRLLEEARQPILQCLRDLQIGPDGIDQLVMVGGSSKIPAARRLVSETVGREPATGCDPMTAVAQGAAIASAILLGQLDKDFFVSTEHALGTIVHDDNQRPRFSVLIPRNRQLPAKESDNYIPAVQGQRSVLVRVIEGDPDKDVSDPDNVVLKEWSIDVDPDLSQQENAFDIGYEYNVDGILHITVTNTRTGRVMLRDDVSFGVTKDKSKLIDLANRVRTTVESGHQPAALPSPVPVPALDSATVHLLERARNKVVPFVGEDEGERLEALCADLERSVGAASDECREALERKLRQYAYLF